MALEGVICVVNALARERIAHFGLTLDRIFDQASSARTARRERWSFTLGVGGLAHAGQLRPSSLDLDAV